MSDYLGQLINCSVIVTFTVSLIWFYKLGQLNILNHMSRMSQWKPIETAPKDGTSILGYFPGRGGYVARQDMIPIHWCGWGGGMWQNSTSGHNLMSNKVTHWMPLPDPPSD